MAQGGKPETWQEEIFCDTHRTFPVVDPAIYLVIEQRTFENCKFSHSRPIEPKVLVVEVWVSTSRVWRFFGTNLIGREGKCYCSFYCSQTME